MTKLSRVRGVALLLVAFAMIAAACNGDDDTADTTAAPEPTETTAAPATEAPTDTTAAPSDTTEAPPAAPAGFTYNMGIFQDLQTDNFWAYYGPDGTVWSQYVLAPTKPALYDVLYPALGVIPDVAVGLPPEPVQEGDNWVVVVDMKSDYTWSDGTALTAADVEFTFDAVNGAALGGDWLQAYPYTEASNPRLLDVEATSDTQVKYTFAAKPGLAVWPHNVGVAPIMPKHFWEPVLTAALESEDPASTLYGADPTGDPSGGESVYAGREEGAFAKNTANADYYWNGTEVTQYTSGVLRIGDEIFYGDPGGDELADFTYGPYMSEAVFSLYGDQTAAVLALQEGETDYLLNPLGMQRGLQQEALASENLEVVVNAPNGFRYLAFNLRKSPGSYNGYRQAIAYMIDKEFLTTNVLQGVALPLYVLIPEGNKKWYNEEAANEISTQYVGLSEGERVQAAVDALKADGFTWETEPTVDEDGNVTPGVGLIDPTGTKVAEQEILAPPASYDPLRATASLWIEGWMETLGIPARANPTDFGAIVDAVWPGVGEEIPFDAYILGWSLGNPALPSFHESFFHSRNLAEVNDGSNSVGLEDAEFDALADGLLAATNETEAFDLIWQMEEKLAELLPYVVLFDTPIIEFYNTNVTFPFTSTLSGIQIQTGFQDTVIK